MKLQLRSKAEIEVDRYYEDWSEGGVRRGLTIEGDADVAELGAALTDPELSAASLVRAAGEVKLPALHADGIHRSVDEGGAVVDVSLSEA